MGGIVRYHLTMIIQTVKIFLIYPVKYIIKDKKKEPLHLKDSFLHKINLSIFNLSLIFTLDKENVSAITPTIEQEILHLQLDTLAHRHISLQKL